MDLIPEYLGSQIVLHFGEEALNEIACLANRTACRGLFSALLTENVSSLGQ